MRSAIRHASSSLVCGSGASEFLAAEPADQVILPQEDLDGTGYRSQGTVACQVAVASH